MWKAYLKFDKYLLDKTQEGYLWLLDRTGVYVASVMFVLFCANVACTKMVWDAPILAGIFIAIVGLMLAIPYYMQDKGLKDAYNKLALEVEGGPMRHPVNFFQYGFLFMEIIRLKPLGIVSSLFIIVFQYFWCVKIRDRDKKPFFKPAEGKQDLAYQNGSD